MQPAQQLGRQDLLVHIIQAQVIWICRVDGTPPWKAEWDGFALNMDRSVRAWQRFLFGADMERIVSYDTSDGRHFDSSVSEITRHVINHGTYHRGQLRAIAEQQGVEYPETDYILFCRER